MQTVLVVPDPVLQWFIWLTFVEMPGQALCKVERRGRSARWSDRQVQLVLLPGKQLLLELCVLGIPVIARLRGCDGEVVNSLEDLDQL